VRPVDSDEIEQEKKMKKKKSDEKNKKRLHVITRCNGEETVGIR